MKKLYFEVEEITYSRKDLQATHITLPLSIKEDVYSYPYKL